MGRLGPVEGDAGVGHADDDDDDQLDDETGQADGQHFPQHIPAGEQVGGGEPDGLGPAEVEQSQHSGDELAEDGGPCGPRHAPVQHEDGDGVADEVDDRPNHRGEHGVGSGAVRPDGGVQAVGDDVEGHAQADDAHILHGVGAAALGDAEQPEDGPLEDQAQSAQDHAAHHAEGEGGAHGPAAGVGVVPAQREGQQGGGPVPDEQGDCQGDHREGIDHVGGGVAQIADGGLADEDLVYDVVQGGHQQGQGAGDGESGQQLADGGLAQVGGALGFLGHKYSSLYRKSVRDPPGADPDRPRTSLHKLDLRLWNTRKRIANAIIPRAAAKCKRKFTPGRTKFPPPAAAAPRC